MAYKKKEKKQKAAPLRAEGFNLAEFVSGISAKLGANTVAMAGQAKARKRTFLSSGVNAIDYVTGGGFPHNCITEIRGPFSSLKSTVCYHTIANHQRRYPEGLAALEDGEKSFDPEYAQQAGIDLDRMILINADSGEQAVDALSDVLRAPVPLLCIVDSIASLVPSAEMDASMESSLMGAHPRLVNRAMRLLTKRLKVSMYDADAAPATIIATNQIREKIGVMFGNPETSPGGRGREFYYHMMLRFSSPNSERLMEKVERNGVLRDVRVGQTVNFSVTKNKCGGTQFEEGTFVFYIRPHLFHKAYEFDNEEATLNFGLFHNIINRDTSGATPRFSYGGLQQLTEKAFLHQLHDDTETHAALYCDILAALRLETDACVDVEAAEDIPAPPVTRRKMKAR